MKTPRWLKMRKRSEPELPEEPPIWLNNHSNGEYFHFQTPYERKLKRFILEKADENARKIGMNRRDFLASAMGMATSLWCINLASSCSSNQVGHNVGATGKTDAGGGGGPSDSGGGSPFDAYRPRPAICDTYQIEPQMMYDEKAACAALRGDEFIFDIQTHFFETDGEWITTNPGYVSIIQALTRTQDFGMNHYLDLLFCQSDTTMAVLSCWPGVLCSDVQPPPCGLPMSTDGAAQARDTINRMANSQRLLSHAMILPNDPTGVDAQMAIMEKIACTAGVAAWKLYPAAGKTGGYFVTDPDIGIPIIQKGIELGVPLFCIHKGLPIPGFDFPHNQPSDIGPIAAQFPQANFIIYHAAINSGVTLDGGAGTPSSALNEGPYVEGDVTGVNALITSMKKSGIGPNQNVFAEMGSSWGQVYKHADQAAHYLGKLLKYVGENNVCWGTDSLVGGTPQPLIEGLRAASIPADMQATYGYPELTAERKAKIFGLNSARIYRVDPKARRCGIDCEVGMLKKGLDEEVGERRWAFNEPLGPKTFAEYVRQGREAIKRGIPG